MYRLVTDAPRLTRRGLDSIDAWLLTQPTLIKKRTRSVLPRVADRYALVALVAC